MLAARELDSRRLTPQARTWVNEHLVYTHGYGLVMSPVNRISEEGMPEFFIKDIPPTTIATHATSLEGGLADQEVSHRARPVVALDDVRRLQNTVRLVHMDRALMHYASQLVGVTRDPEQVLPKQYARLVEYGASPRATIAFCKAARALAVLSGRAHVIPDDIAKLAAQAFQNRISFHFCHSLISPLFFRQFKTCPYPGHIVAISKAYRSHSLVPVFLQSWFAVALILVCSFPLTPWRQLTVPDN